MIHQKIKNLKSLPLFLLLFTSLTLLNNLIKQKNIPLYTALFLPLSFVSLTTNFLSFIIQRKKKEEVSPTKLETLYSFFFAILDSIIFYSATKIIINQPIIIVIHGIILSVILVNLFFTVPTEKVAFFLGISFGCTFYVSGLSDCHLRGIAKSVLNDFFTILPPVGIYFLLFTCLLTLRMYFFFRSEVSSSALLPFWISIFSFLVSVFFSLCDFNSFMESIKVYFGVSFVICALSFGIVYFLLLRMQDYKLGIINFAVCGALFGVFYVFRVFPGNIFRKNLLEREMSEFHLVLFLNLGLMVYVVSNFVFRRIAFTVWMVELLGF